jgi:hypothetical protein
VGFFVLNFFLPHRSVLQLKKHLLCAAAVTIPCPLFLFRTLAPHFFPSPRFVRLCLDFTFLPCQAFSDATKPLMLEQNTPQTGPLIALPLTRSLSLLTLKPLEVCSRSLTLECQRAFALISSSTHTRCGEERLKPLVRCVVLH